MSIWHWLVERLRAARAALVLMRKNRAAQRALVTFNSRMSEWDAERKILDHELQAALVPDGFGRDANDLALVLRKGEDVFCIMNGAALVEAKQLPGRWIGGYAGVSLRVMKGVSYHTGGTRGTYVPGPTSPAAIAVGKATITSQRVVFQSDKQAREVSFAKLLGYQHDPSLPVTYFQVSNRQKVSGIGYDLEIARTWRFRLSLALARFTGESAQFAQHLRDEIRQHEMRRPTLSQPN